MFNVFDKIKPQSIDLLLTDFPYGTLNKRNTWDTIIDYDKFWKYVDIIYVNQIQLLYQLHNNHSQQNLYLQTMKCSDIV